VTYTSLRGPHKSLVAHPSLRTGQVFPGPSGELDSSPASSSVACRAAPGAPPLPSSGTEPNDEVAWEDGSYDSGAASVRARPWRDSVTDAQRSRIVETHRRARR
jgi:hypothetical protein